MYLSSRYFIFYSLARTTFLADIYQVQNSESKTRRTKVYERQQTASTLHLPRSPSHLLLSYIISYKLAVLLHPERVDRSHMTG